MRWFPIILFSLPLLASHFEVEVSAPSAILVNVDTGKILFEKAAGARHYPASTTKIATAKLAFELAGDRLDEVVEAQRDALIMVEPTQKRTDNFSAPSHWNETDGSHIGLAVGEKMPLAMLLAGLMLESGNDAANVIAQHLSGSQDAFIETLNSRLHETGLRETHFTNPHGLHHPQHVTTAREMALLARWAWSEPRLRELVGQPEVAHPGTNRRKSGRFVQFNQLLRSGRHYDSRAIGFKTGYHAAAGYNLVAVAEQGGRTLIAVIFGCSDRNQRYVDARALFDAVFAEESIIRRISVAEHRFKRDRLKAVPAADFSLRVYPSEDGPIQLVTEWMVPSGRIAKGEPVGQLQATTPEGVVLASVPLLASRSVGKGFSDVRLWLIAGGAIFLIWFFRPRRKA